MKCLLPVIQLIISVCASGSVIDLDREVTKHYHDDPHVNKAIGHILDLDTDFELDCATVKSFYHVVKHTMVGEGEEVDPELHHLNKGCEDGTLVTAEDIEKKRAELKTREVADIDLQIKNMAHEICKSEDKPESVLEACEKEIVDPDEVVDAAAAVNQRLPDDHFEEVEEVCRSLKKHGKKIDVAMMDLASSTERRLGRSLSEVTHVTGHKLGSDLLDMYKCVCDAENPTNKGCTRKIVQFFDDAGNSISEQAEEDFKRGNKMVDLDALQTSLEQNTRHLRNSRSSLTNSSSLDLDMIQSDSGLQKCKPPGIQQRPHGEGYTLCLYAGPVLSCSLSFGSTTACLSSSCSAGSLVSIGASVSVCPGPILSMELSLCVTAVSEILEAIGDYIPAQEKMFNKFNIYAGCYKLATATYDIPNNRFEVISPQHHIRVYLNTIISIGGHARFRFKGQGCAYTDEKWFPHEYGVKHLGSGDFQAPVDYNAIREYENYYHRRGNCPWHSFPWGQFTIDFHTYLAWPAYSFVKGWHTKSTTVYRFHRGFKISA